MPSLASRGVFAVLLILCSAVVVVHGFHFMSIGDWGCIPVGGWGARDERVVAKSFSDQATAVNARFILNTGDNFYACGVHAKSDEMWKNAYEDVFTAPSVQVPWYSCLGNHDYGYPGSAEAEVEYLSPKNNRWVLPARYYYRRLVFDEVNISLVVLDSSPCNKLYRGDDEKHWDPCGLHFDKKKCPGCSFHDNILKQNCSEQLVWLHSILPTIPHEDWKIVMTHAPAHELDVDDLLTPLYNHNFDLFINGHIHRLQHYKVAGKEAMNFVTTGAGCWVRVPDNATTSSAKVSGGATPAQPQWMQDAKVDTQKRLGAIEWEDVVAGYTMHQFEDNFKTLVTKFVNYEGAVIHTISVAKRTPQ